MDPQKRKLLKDNYFGNLSLIKDKYSWKSFKMVVEGHLGNHKNENDAIGVNMSLKRIFF